MSRAEVVHQRQAVAAGDGGDLFQPRPLLEADDAEVRLVDAEQDGGLRADRPLVVRRLRPVRRPDLHEPGPRAGQHVRDPEAVADLDQLAARDDDVAPLPERREREQDGARIVVDDQRGLRAGQPAQDRRDVVLPRPAGALGEVVLEVGVAARGVDDPRERLLCERRPAEVRVDDDARRVEHTLQARPSRVGQLLAQPRCEVAGVRARLDLLARPVDHPARGVDRERVARLARELVHRGKVAEPHGYCASAFSGSCG
jgi:hypothetical protein